MEDGDFDHSYHPDEMYGGEDSYYDGGDSYADTLFSGNPENSYTEGEGPDSIPDVMLLNVYCARAMAPKDTEESRIEAEKSWAPVRQWLSSHNADEVRAAAEQRGESGLTALHFAVQWPDSFGWLPIHYACASGSDTEVIKALAEAYPESKTTVDRRGRTPLHFALGDKPACPDVISLLSATGAASFPDEIGMLVRP
jgi:Ankyrin repeats (3 copies)